MPPRCWPAWAAAGCSPGWPAWYAGRAQVVGVEPEGAPTLTAAMRAGRPVDAEAGSVAVDSLAPRRVGELTFAIIRQNAARVLLVDDDAIVATQRLLWETLRVVAEPGGCAALAALVSGRCEPAPGETVAVVISGANTTAVDFGRAAGCRFRLGKQRPGGALSRPALSRGLSGGPGIARPATRPTAPSPHRTLGVGRVLKSQGSMTGLLWTGRRGCPAGLRFTGGLPCGPLL